MAMQSIFLGTPAGYEQRPIVSPAQLSGQETALQRALQMLGNRQDLSFAPQAQLAREQFAQRTIPGIAERFTAMGGGGAQRSSAFQGALGAAGAGLESQLAALGSQYGLQHQGQNDQLMQLLFNLGLQPQFENIPFGAQPGLSEILTPFAQQYFMNQNQPGQPGQHGQPGTTMGNIGNTLLGLSPALAGIPVAGPWLAAGTALAGAGLSGANLLRNRRQQQRPNVTGLGPVAGGGTNIPIYNLLNQNLGNVGRPNIVGF